MFQKAFTSLVDCLQYGFCFCQVHKFVYFHIVNFSRVPFWSAFVIFFKHLFWKRLSLTSSALQICENSVLYSKMEFTRLLWRLILVSGLVFCAVFFVFCQYAVVVKCLFAIFTLFLSSIRYKRPHYSPCAQASLHIIFSSVPASVLSKSNLTPPSSFSITLPPP